LFLGNNDSATDTKVSELAQEHETKNHGLVTDPKFEPDSPGFYHTTVTDMPWGDLLELSQRFNAVVMLDQPQRQWSHWKCLQATCKLMLQLESLGVQTVFRQNENTQKILYWIDLLYHKNPSLCIYPWINFHNDGRHFKVCSRDASYVTANARIEDWQTNPYYQEIRQSMLAGEHIMEHCSVCYGYENQGMESYRQFETLDWATQLELSSVDDLLKIKEPHFYEVHTSNHCNIKCRGCQPKYSEPIGLEFKKFNIVTPERIDWASNDFPIDQINIDSLDSTKSVYFQGGEPTIMPEVRAFMQQCIERNRTDFFLTMCTNGVKFSREFLDLVSHFSNTNFSFSIDGFDRVNDYWRWGSRWQTVIDNAHLLQSLGHSISINTVPGIYNVTNLHLLLEFLDREFPFAAIYMQVNYLPWQSCLNHPLTDLVLDSMQRCQQTSIYHSNGKSCKTSIDSIYAHYANDPVCDLKELQNFFDFNDQLDRARGSRLVDYIPELEAARSFLR
jgi:pyruvate-formate lyase-activating enzyme